MTKATKNDQMIDAALANFKTTSGKIRYLNSLGLERGQIAKRLGIKYQWVRNVLITQVTKPKE